MEISRDSTNKLVSVCLDKDTSYYFVKKANDNNIPIEELLENITKKLKDVLGEVRIKVSSHVSCPVCDGSGLDGNCYRCNGTGIVFSLDYKKIELVMSANKYDEAVKSNLLNFNLFPSTNLKSSNEATANSIHGGDWSDNFDNLDSGYWENYSGGSDE